MATFGAGSSECRSKTAEGKCRFPALSAGQECRSGFGGLEAALALWGGGRRLTLHPRDSSGHVFVAKADGGTRRRHGAAFLLEGLARPLPMSVLTAGRPALLNPKLVGAFADPLL